MFNKYFTFLFFIAITTSIVGCKDDVLPKPKAYLSLDYPKPNYSNFDKTCGYSFQYNTNGKVVDKGNCNFDIDYPKLKATVYLNYKPINNNLKVLLRDAQKLTYEHVIKADGISEQPYANKERKAYGMCYEVGGNAASQSQFYLTDSTKHFLRGALYFDSSPNEDSLKIVNDFILQDMRHLISTLKWKN